NLLQSFRYSGSGDAEAAPLLLLGLPRARQPGLRPALRRRLRGARIRRAAGRGRPLPRARVALRPARAHPAQHRRARPPTRQAPGNDRAAARPSPHGAVRHPQRQRHPPPPETPPPAPATPTSRLRRTRLHEPAPRPAHKAQAVLLRHLPRARPPPPPTRAKQSLTAQRGSTKTAPRLARRRRRRPRRVDRALGRSRA